MVTIASLKKGQRGIIKEFSVDIVPLKLLEMGCLPGNEVALVQTAPFQDPMYLNVNGAHLAIRKETAAQIEIEIIKQ
ncbi:MAG: FeoA family protein [Patiriisocius sp.]|jgi:ferrous iron transport protein A|tara:strand:- start:579 stop:809 length:231 start_codon:yes stop_codon:yes gene_type:complete